MPRPGKRIHCNLPTPLGNICFDCAELLRDLDEPDDSPPPAPARPAPRPGRFEPSPADWAALAEMSVRGEFLPPAARTPQAFHVGTQRMVK